MCCSPWGHKESDTTERLNGTGFSFFTVANIASSASGLLQGPLLAHSYFIFKAQYLHYGIIHIYHG